MNSLALELIDEIIGHVDEKDDMRDGPSHASRANYLINTPVQLCSIMSRSHLLACSLVCRLWLPLSQRRLFHHTRFRADPREIQRLDQVLLNSPHLASYIRVLELPMLRSCLSLRLIRKDKPLYPLLGKFTHVRELKISGLNWKALPRYFRQSIFRILELPSMAFLYINDAQFICTDDFRNFISHARGPIGLSLTRINTSQVPAHSFKLETKQVEDNKDKVVRLTRMDMRWNNRAFDNWFLGPRSHVDVSHVHTLHIHLPRTKDDCVNLLLCAMGSSLKHVSFVLPYAFPVLVNLAFNVNIEFLSLVHVCMGEGCPSMLSRVLATVHASNHMHHMELRVEAATLHGPSVDWAAWGEVYRVLAGPRLQFLRVLYINVMAYTPLNSHDDTLLQMLKDMAAAHPLLATRGVRVSLCPQPGGLREDQCIFCSAECL